MHTFWKHDTEEVGENYFRVKIDGQGQILSAIRVIFRPGKRKRGRSNCYGIHEITRLTFITNWMNRKESVEITEKQFFTAFDFVSDRMLATL